jgi:hypothetical protein
MSAMQTVFLFQQKRILCHSLGTRGKKGELYILAQAPLSSDEHSDIDTENIAPCYHAEADTRMFFHANHAAVTGSKNIIISSSDTDVVVLAIYVFIDLHINELWIAFGNYLFLTINKRLFTMKVKNYDITKLGNQHENLLKREIQRM